MAEGPEIVIDAMSVADIAAADELWQAAFDPPVGGELGAQRTDADIERDRARIAHVLGTDPLGSVVARIDGRVVGFAQGIRRAHRFVLSRLGVHPASQDRKVGTRLLHAALAYGDSASEQYIFSSRDPRALHSYVREGFALHPAVRLAGHRHASAVTGSVRIAQASELPAIALLDEEVRGGSARMEDLRFWHELGAAFVLDEEDAYAVVLGDRLTTLGARDVVAARRLFSALLCGFGGLEPVSVGFVTAEQQWAIAAAAQCRATITPSGAVMSRNVAAMAREYLANPMLG